MGAVAAERRVPHVYCTENHDDRAGFPDALGSGHLAADTGELLDQDHLTRAAVSRVDGWRIITLDSLVPGQTQGHLDEHQLTWLSRVLASPAELGTVLVFHHPPLRLPSIPYVAQVVLQNLDLDEVVRGTDVRTILTGHLYFQASGFFGHVPVCVSPGVVTRIDTSAPPHLVRGVLGAGATVVDLAEPTAPTFQLVLSRDPRAGEEVYVYDASTGQDVIESCPAHRCTRRLPRGGGRPAGVSRPGAAAPAGTSRGTTRPLTGPGYPGRDPGPSAGPGPQPPAGWHAFALTADAAGGIGSEMVVIQVQPVDLDPTSLRPRCLPCG